MTKFLHVGGLVAVGFDPSGAFLLTVTHSGRGVFCTKTWEKVARDHRLAYPEGGKGTGIGPIEGMEIPVVELDLDSERLVASPDGTIQLRCESSGIEVMDAGK